MLGSRSGAQVTGGYKVATRILKRCKIWTDDDAQLLLLEEETYQYRRTKLS